MKTARSSTGRMLLGASALALVLFLPAPPASAADDVARQETVPTVTITADATTHNEADGPMRFTLHASPAPTADLEVELDSRQTGVVFADAVEQSFTETIPAGEMSHTFDFAVVNDFVVEPDGTITITVADSETSYDVGTPSQAETALTDDDVPITVSWDTSPVHVDEGAGSVSVSFFIRVHDGKAPGTFTTFEGVFEGLTFYIEPYLVSPDPVVGVADPFTDYVYESYSFAYEVGSFAVDDSGDYTLTDSFEVQILDDTVEEPGETIEFVFENLLSEPLQTDDTVLPSNSKTVVITDNDGDPPEPPQKPWPPPDFCPTHPDTPADTSTPLSVEVGGSVEADFCSKEDADWVQVSLAAGQAYRIEGTYTPPDGERRIYIGAMRDPDGGLITGSHSFDGNPDGTSNTSGYINFRPTETGTHYIVAGHMDWWDFQDATGPLRWRIEVHEIDLPPDDVPDVHHLTQEFNNYGQLVASFDGTINTHGDRDTFSVDAVAGHTYYVEMRSRNGSGVFNCIHGIASAETPEERRPNSRQCWHRPGWRANRWLKPAASGRYLITVGSDNGTGDYLLRVHDTDAVSPRVADTPVPEDGIGQHASTIHRPS